MLQEFFFKCFIMLGHNWKVDVALIIFPKKFSFEANGQFGPNLGQNYATLYLMIGPKNFIEIW